MTRMNKMSKQAVLILFLVAAAVADKTPVLIWSSEIPMSDLPQSHIGQSVKTDQFSSSYLTPLTSEHNLIVFLQDKLTLEDFINHADVYNINGDGGAFKNVKASLDEQYSVQLPAVSDPAQAIRSLMESFSGKVTKVDHPDNIGSLSLEDGKQNLIIIQLPNVVGKDEGEAFKRNDEMIGKCLHHLKKRAVKFSAVYTAESPSIVEEEMHIQRHLLAANDTNSTGAFFVTPQTMMYLKSINITVVKMSKDPNKPDTSVTIPFKKTEVAVTGKNITGNSSKAEEITITLGNAMADVTILMNIRTTVQGEYQSFNGNVTVNYKNGTGQDYNVDKMPVDMKIQATKGFCFHCSKLKTTPVLKGFNNTNNNKVLITIEGFQFEAFTNITAARFSSHVWDCVEFFTSGIWMGILTTLILILILFFGVNMIASITTMDRFDDPKGKTITVTVKE